MNEIVKNAFIALFDEKRKKEPHFWCGSNTFFTYFDYLIFLTLIMPARLLIASTVI